MTPAVCTAMEERQLESGGGGGGGHTLHHALSQHHPSLSWAERYKIALDMASSLASHEIFIHAHGELKLSDIFLGSKETELWDTTKPRCVEDFGKVLYALISAKENSATLPSSIVGDHRRLGRAESRVYRAALWLRHHTIPPLPWACPLRRYYILNEVDVDGRVRNEIMASGRAIVQLATAIRVVVQCTQDDPGSRPTMAKVYSSLAAANSCEIPWSLTAAVSIGFRLYRSLATLVYVAVFLYVGIYKSLGLFVYYFPLEAFAMIRLLCYLQKVQNMDDHRWPKLIVKEKLDRRRNTWMKQNKKWMEKWGVNMQDCPSSNEEIKKYVKQKFKKALWTKQSGRKKDYYIKEFNPKGDHDEKAYIGANIKWRAKMLIAQLRTSSHRLRCETGRWMVPKEEWEERICRFCDMGLVETEWHFVMECSAYKDIRVTYGDILQVDNLNTLFEEERLVKSANYIIKIHCRRANLERRSQAV